MGTKFVENEFGLYLRVNIDRQLYSEDAAMRAAYWMSDRAYIEVENDTELGIVAKIRSKTENTKDNLAQLGGEYSNALTDFQLREKIQAETQDIQAALLQRAFLELVPKPQSAG